MIRTISDDVTINANSEELPLTISAPEDKRWIVRRLLFEQTTDVALRAYKDQDRIVDVRSEANQLDFQPVPVDLQLAPGERLRIGALNNTGGTVTFTITAEIEETAS